MFTAIALILGAIVTAVGVGLSYDSQQKSNQANLQSVQDTNKTNKEISDKTNQENQIIAQQAQQFNEMQADKAYNRSTPTNQIRELIAAGYSPQQAKEIVADSGSAGTYTPAAAVPSTSVSPTMQAGQINPFNFDLSSIGNLLSSVGGSLDNFSKDLTSDDGGFFGYVKAEKGIAILSEHLNDIPKRYLTSPHSLQSWIRTKYHNDEFDWVKNNKVVFEDIFKSPRATLALQHHLALATSNFTNGAIYEHNINQLTRDKLGIEHDTLVNSLANLDIQSKGFQNIMLAMDVDNYPTVSRAAFLEAEAKIQMLEEDILIKNDPQYKSYHKLRILADEESSYYVAAAAGLEAQAKKLPLQERIKLYEDESNLSLITILHEMNACGLTKSDIGSLISFMFACGVDIPEHLRKLGTQLDVVLDDSSNTKDKLFDLLKGKISDPKELDDLVNGALKELEMAKALSNPLDFAIYVLKSKILPKILELVLGD